MNTLDFVRTLCYTVPYPTEIAFVRESSVVFGRPCDPNMDSTRTPPRAYFRVYPTSPTPPTIATTELLNAWSLCHSPNPSSKCTPKRELVEQ